MCRHLGIAYIRGASSIIGIRSSETSAVGAGYKNPASRLRSIPHPTIMGQSTMLLSIFAFVLAVSLCSSSSGVDNIMSCMFCEIITEAFESESTPAGVVQGMFKRCNRMGLMEPVCDHFISSNAKKIFILARGGTPPPMICEKLHLCDDTR